MNEVDKAFSEVDRRDFLPSGSRDDADLDIPIQIGYGQTNSQPTTVRRMLSWLNAKPGNKVLDVGSGSGWTSALIAKLVSPGGKVYAVEKIPQLVQLGKNNIRRSSVRGVRFYQAGRDYGLPDYAPYERILVSASAKEVPGTLLNQLKINGKMVLPVKHSIFEITRESESEFTFEEHKGFVFVPLIK